MSEGAEDNPAFCYSNCLHTHADWKKMSVIEHAIGLLFKMVGHMWFGNGDHYGRQTFGVSELECPGIIHKTW